MAERPIRILVHPDTDRDLLINVREVLDRAVAERPDHWEWRAAEGTSPEFFAWSDPLRSSIVLAAEPRPYVYQRLTLWPGRDAVYDLLADLVRDHYGL